MTEILTIICWDVQHGNAILIRTPDKKTALIDLGKGSYSKNNLRFSPLEHTIKRNKLKNIELVVITHPHLDHIEDVGALKDISINQIVLPKHLSKKDYVNKRTRSRDLPVFEAYHSLSKEAQLVDKYVLGEVSFHFYYPKPKGKTRLNDHSVVTVLSYLGHRMILMGDNESISQNELLKNQSFLNLSEKCDILLAPHHGRKDGYHQKMLSHLNPSITIISDGRPKGTSVRQKYAKASRKYKVKSKTGIRRPRKALSTNKDGVIKIEIGNYRNSPSMRIATKPSGV